MTHLNQLNNVVVNSHICSSSRQRLNVCVQIARGLVYEPPDRARIDINKQKYTCKYDRVYMVLL